MTDIVESLDLRALIRDIPNFPEPGIIFRDITPLLREPGALGVATDRLLEAVKPYSFDVIVAMESRGFIFAAPMATRLGVGLVPVRKPGKLPHEVSSVEYALEYGIDALEVHRDALRGGARVLVHDDLLATGGTARALCDLVEGAGAEVVACSFVIELAFLGGRDRLRPYDVYSLISYEAE